MKAGGRGRGRFIILCLFASKMPQNDGKQRQRLRVNVPVFPQTGIISNPLLCVKYFTQIHTHTHIFLDVCVVHFAQLPTYRE